MTPDRIRAVLGYLDAVTIHIGYTGTERGMTMPQKLGVVALLEEITVPFWAHHGDCVGGDAEFDDLVRQVSKCRGVIVHPPTNPRLRAFVEIRPGRDELRSERPYLKRDHDIAFESSTVIGAPDTYREQLRSGTWTTLRYARRLERQFAIVLPDGRVDRSSVSERLWAAP